jgi:hypothetical protein
MDILQEPMEDREAAVEVPRDMDQVKLAEQVPVVKGIEAEIMVDNIILVVEEEQALQEQMVQIDPTAEQDIIVIF